MLLPRCSIDVSRRLRRAIFRNDLTLVQRIVTNEPNALQNPDYSEKSNTSLHIAAREGLLEIAEFLIQAGHDSDDISRNADWDTPLMLAIAGKHIAVGNLLIEHFPQSMPYANKLGMDALMLCSKHGVHPLLVPLLTGPFPPSVHAHDKDGNTALHHASAGGHLKTLRTLLQFGASPHATNAYSWTPIAYSQTASAESYFKVLVAEVEQQKADMREGGARRQMGGAVRLVTSDDVVGRGGEGRAVDDGNVMPPPPRPDWSPVEQRRAMTPTVGRSDGWPIAAQRPPLPQSYSAGFMRTRASSSD